MVLDRLRSPGGALGGLTVASFFLLAVFGVAGLLWLTLDLLFGWESWSDSTGDVVIGLVMFALATLGAYGFVLMDRSPWGGAALTVVGGLAFALVLFWAVLPLVVGVGAAAVAVWRAWTLTHQARAVGAS